MSVDSILHHGRQSAIPHSAYIKTKHNSLALTRATRAFSATSTEYSAVTNNQIIIPIKANTWVDFSRSALSFGVKLKPTVYLAKSAMSLFRRGLIRDKEGKIIQDFPNMDTLSAFLTIHTLNAEETKGSFGITSLTDKEGTGRPIGEPETTYWCTLQLGLSLLRGSELVPMHLTGDLSLEITLQDTSRCCYSGQIAPVVLNPRYLVETVVMSPIAEADFMEAYNKDALEYHHHTYSSMVVSGDKAATTHRLLIPNQFNSLVGVVVLPRYTSDLANNTVNPYRFVNPNISRIEIRVGSEVFEGVNNVAECMWSLQGFLDFSNNANSDVVDRTTFFNSALSAGNEPKPNACFAFGKSFEVSPADETVLSGNVSRGDVELTIYREGTLPNSDVEYTVYLLGDVSVKLGRNIGLQAVY